MKLLQEFKDFAVKGNVVDMAVGIIIGVAFGKIVSSLVADVIMPPIGALIGGVDFTQLTLDVRSAAGDKPAVVIRYGQFLQTVFDFLIVAFAVFGLVKGVQRLRRKPPEPGAVPPPPTQEVQLLTQIRDLLQHK